MLQKEIKELKIFALNASTTASKNTDDLNNLQKNVHIDFNNVHYSMGDIKKVLDIVTMEVPIRKRKGIRETLIIIFLIHVCFMNQLVYLNNTSFYTNGCFCKYATNH